MVRPDFNRCFSFPSAASSFLLLLLLFFFFLSFSLSLLQLLPLLLSVLLRITVFISSLSLCILSVPTIQTSPSPSSLSSPSPSVFLLLLLLLLDHSSVLVFSLIYVCSIVVSVYLCCPRSFSSVLHVPRCDRVLRWAAAISNHLPSSTPVPFFFSSPIPFFSSFSLFSFLLFFPSPSLFLCLLGVPVKNPIRQLTSLSLSPPFFFLPLSLSLSVNPPLLSSPPSPLVHSVQFSPRHGGFRYHGHALPGQSLVAGESPERGLP